MYIDKGLVIGHTSTTRSQPAELFSQVRYRVKFALPAVPPLQCRLLLPLLGRFFSAAALIRQLLLLLLRSFVGCPDGCCCTSLPTAAAVSPAAADAAPPAAVDAALLATADAPCWLPLTEKSVENQD